MVTIVVGSSESRSGANRELLQFSGFGVEPMMTRVVRCPWFPDRRILITVLSRVSARASGNHFPSFF